MNKKKLIDNKESSDQINELLIKLDKLNNTTSEKKVDKETLNNVSKTTDVAASKLVTNPPINFKSAFLGLFVLMTVAIMLFFICFAIQLLEYQNNKNNFDKNTKSSTELDSEICHNMPHDVFKFTVVDTYVEIYSYISKKERKSVIETIRGQCSEFLKINPEPDIDDTNSFVDTMKKNFKELGSLKDMFLGFMNQIKNAYDGIRMELSNSTSSLGFITDIGIIIFGIMKIFYIILVNFILLIVKMICFILKKLFFVLVGALILACSKIFLIIPCLILLAILIVPIIFIAAAIVFFCVFVVNALLLLLVAKVGYQVRTKSFH